MPTIDSGSLASVILPFVWPYQVTTPSGDVSTGSRITFDQPVIYHKDVYNLIAVDDSIFVNARTFPTAFTGQHLSAPMTVTTTGQFALIADFANRLAMKTYDISPDFAGVISKTLDRLL
jgi:hypothetical protein